MSNANGSKWIRPEKRLAIYHRDGFACIYCGSSADEGAALSLDHVTPRELGGTHHADNLVTCCIKCNASKQDDGMRGWFQSLRDRGIDTAKLSRRIRAATARPLDIAAGKALRAARAV
jgi:5-methylcytosine-specific restriction endonuclease McrA